MPGNILTFIYKINHKYTFSTLSLLIRALLQCPPPKVKYSTNLRHLRNTSNLMLWNALYMQPKSNIDLAGVISRCQKMYWTFLAFHVPHFIPLLHHQTWKIFGNKEKASFIVVLNEMKYISLVERAFWPRYQLWINKLSPDLFWQLQYTCIRTCHQGATLDAILEVRAPSNLGHLTI